MPALSVVLVNAEDKKGEPLTYDEVIEIRNQSHCVMVHPKRARELAESRGYEDIDPENCWYEWQLLRRELGRKPDLDPGPKINQIRGSDPEYQQTIRDAHATIDQFRNMLPTDGTARLDALIKTEIHDGEESAFMWLSNTRLSASGFVAEFTARGPRDSKGRSLRDLDLTSRIMKLERFSEVF